jgi:hypothetical protein
LWRLAQGNSPPKAFLRMSSNQHIYLLPRQRQHPFARSVVVR